jgi:hypothetical protein
VESKEKNALQICGIEKGFGFSTGGLIASRKYPGEDVLMPGTWLSRLFKGNS